MSKFGRIIEKLKQLNESEHDDTRNPPDLTNPHHSHSDRSDHFAWKPDDVTVEHPTHPHHDRSDHFSWKPEDIEIYDDPDVMQDKEDEIKRNEMPEDRHDRFQWKEGDFSISDK